MVAPARQAALAALCRLATGAVDLGDALSQTRDGLPDVRDRALVTDLVVNTLRWRARLDHQLQRLLAKPLARLDRPVLEALRLGAYQLLYLDRVPPRAVVHDVVELVKGGGFRSAGGLANAVLRRLARERFELPWPSRPEPDGSPRYEQAVVEYLAIMHSHPAWLVRRWVDRYGAANAERWLQFNNEVPATTIAANRLLNSRTDLAADLAAEGLRCRPTTVAPHGLVVEAGHVMETAAYRRGATIVQDEASQLVAELVRVESGQRVLDACAAPGGKTVALAAASASSSRVVATEVRYPRIRLLAETLGRLHVPSVRIVHADIDHDWPFRDETFDWVLVDAPCSGLGTLRREPDIRWRRAPEDLPALAGAQLALLRRLQRLVRSGGRLVYATCSSEPEENEAVVDAFLGETRQFRAVPLTAVSGLSPVIVAMSTTEGYLRTTPLEGLEAFFGAVLERGL
ncbi:MAG: 16S rRNA (cytosine(967)-C(5))-methyltransferase RsmB [Acidobacteriota bacterium]